MILFFPLSHRRRVRRAGNHHPRPGQARRQHVGHHFAFARRDQCHAGLGFGHFLEFQNLEQRPRNLGVLGDLVQRAADHRRADRLGLGELHRRLAVGRAGDDRNLVGAVLLDRRGHLAQAVDHLGLDLADHPHVAEMHFADVNRPQFVAPLLALGRDLAAYRLAHVMAAFQHPPERHVGETAHRGVADVGRQRAARVGVLEQKRHRVADIHLVPDADPHRGAFLAVDGLAAQVFLVQAHIEHVAAPHDVGDEGRRPQARRQEVQAGFV